jgi:hypothetical protein
MSALQSDALIGAQILALWANSHRGKLYFPKAQEMGAHSAVRLAFEPIVHRAFRAQDARIVR